MWLIIPLIIILHILGKLFGGTLSGMELFGLIVLCGIASCFAVEWTK